MKTKLLAVIALAGACAFAQDYYPPAPPQATQNYPPEAYAALPPPCGPGTVWIDGYLDEYGNQVPGYCGVPPYAGAYWIAPGWFGGHFAAGYWGSGPVVRGGFGYRYAPGGNEGFGQGRTYGGGHIDQFRGAPGRSEGFRAPTRSEGFRSSGGGSNNFNSHGGGGYRGASPSSHVGGSRGGRH